VLVLAMMTVAVEGEGEEEGVAAVMMLVVVALSVALLRTEWVGHLYEKPAHGPSRLDQSLTGGGGGARWAPG
jgi:hypothetical protein